jgi:hypothetical protein
MQDELHARPCIAGVHQQVPGLLHYQDRTGFSVAPKTRIRPVPCSITART